MNEKLKLSPINKEDPTGNISYLTTQLESMSILLHGLLNCHRIHISFFDDKNGNINSFQVNKNGQTYFGDIWWNKTKQALEQVLVSRVNEIQAERDYELKKGETGWSCPSLKDY